MSKKTIAFTKSLKKNFETRKFSKKKFLLQGAEALITLDSSLHQITKTRQKKSYRLQTLDNKIRKSRTKSESKLLEKSAQIIPIPKLINTNEKSFSLTMEHIKGKKLSDSLSSLDYKKISQLIGKQLAKLHNADIIHGDLTTSNMILSDKDSQLYFIDFGLGFVSSKAEDKAVDLHLIKQALKAKHFKISQICFEQILKTYKKTSNNSGKILSRLEKVESRGRYKQST
jgi:Kae1-associated kinase Bud32